MGLKDEEWALIEPLMPVSRRADGRSRPPRDPRQVLNGILWILRTGARWQDLPPRYPPHQTCHRTFKMGEKRCVFDHFRSFGRGFTPTRRPGFIRVFHRRHLCAGKKGGLCVGKTKRGKGTKIMALADGAGLPLAIYLASASPHEVTLVEDTLANRFVAKIPRRIIGDKVYDSDALDQILEGQGIEMITPHRSNRKKPKTQDGRALRRYKRRWKIERLFAWIFNFRRLLVRHEYYSENFLAFVSLGCIKILIRYY